MLDTVTEYFHDRCRIDIDSRAAAISTWAWALATLTQHL